MDCSEESASGGVPAGLCSSVLVSACSHHSSTPWPKGNLRSHTFGLS
jgi:hypothetical protein